MGTARHPKPEDHLAPYGLAPQGSFHREGSRPSGRTACAAGPYPPVPTNQPCPSMVDPLLEGTRTAGPGPWITIGFLPRLDCSTEPGQGPIRGFARGRFHYGRPARFAVPTISTPRDPRPDDPSGSFRSFPRAASNRPLFRDRGASGIRSGGGRSHPPKREIVARTSARAAGRESEHDSQFPRIATGRATRTHAPLSSRRRHRLPKVVAERSAANRPNRDR